MAAGLVSRRLLHFSRNTDEIGAIEGTGVELAEVANPLPSRDLAQKSATIRDLRNPAKSRSTATASTTSKLPARSGPAEAAPITLAATS
jgi:hypothetical protein